MRTRHAPTPPLPEIVRDEAILIPPGETGYWLLLDDPTVELLAQGIVPEDLAQRCHRDLEWKREHYRNTQRTSPFDPGAPSAQSDAARE